MNGARLPPIDYDIIASGSYSTAEAQDTSRSAALRA